MGMYKSPGGFAGKSRRLSEEDMKRSVEDFFGKNYVKIILSPTPENYNDYITSIQEFVTLKLKGVKTAQLRNVFHRVKRAENFFEVVMLRPKLAYTAARSDQNGLKILMFLLDSLIQGGHKLQAGRNDKDLEQRHLKNLKMFFESVIAYHKYAGGD